VPSVNRRIPRLAVLALCGALLAGTASGCSTTEEKAEIQQARAKHILAARAARQKQQADGPKSRARLNKSAHRSKKGNG
jgi:hypothetical protein